MITIFHYFGHFLGRLPLFIQSTLGSLLGIIMSIVMNKRRKIVFHNLGKVYPDHTPNQIKELAKLHFRHLGQLVVELLSLPAFLLVP